MKVWLVATGEYSAYMVHAVFSDKTAAETYLGEIGSTGDELEEFDLYGPDATIHHELSLGGMVYRDLIGAIVVQEPGERKEPTLEPVPLRYSLRAIDNAPYRTSPPRTYYDDRINIHVAGTDHDRVRKVYSEQQAQALANFEVIIAAERARPC